MIPALEATGTARQHPRCAYWPIVPVPAPRQTSSDRWKRGHKMRPKVARYRAFCDECRIRRVWPPQSGDLIVFLLPIPKSRAREGLDGLPHTQTPDLDNLVKALLDALYDDDARIWSLTPVKLWSATPGIVIDRRSLPIGTPFRLPPDLLAQGMFPAYPYDAALEKSP